MKFFNLAVRFSQFFSILIILAVFLTSIARAQEDDVDRVLFLIGSNHPANLAGFVNAALAKSQDQNVNILVLPIGYSSNPEVISNAERSKDLNNAGILRTQVGTACRQAAPENITCNVILAPILTRSDALNRTALEYITDDLSAVLILDGDHKIAQQVIGGTPLEQALDEAYQKGVVVAGSGNGGNLLSLAMLGGYNQSNSAENALNFGAIDVWNDAAKHGFLFGIQNAIIDQHFFIDNRLGRLLNAISSPDAPHLGIGIDSSTGLTISDGIRLGNVFEGNPVVIFDAETYHASQAVHYHGPNNTLSLRNVLFHLLTPGEYSTYNLDTRHNPLVPPLQRIERNYDSLKLPPGAGPLIIAGGLGESLDDNPILERFVSLTGIQNGEILIVATGYSSDRVAENVAMEYAKALGILSQINVVPMDSTTPINLPDELNGIILIGNDQSKIQASTLFPLKQAWLSGKPLLADDAGAAAIGQFFSVHGPSPSNKKDKEIAIRDSFLADGTTFAPGLGLLDMNTEPQAISDTRWARLFSLAYNYPNLLSLGLTKNTAVEISSDGAVALGENVVLGLDLRDSFLDLGANDMYVILNGLLDVFSPGDIIRPEIADIHAAAPEHAPTPVLPSPTLAGFIVVTSTPPPSPSPTIHPTDTPTPTKTPKPTATPLDIPPPADPGTSNLMVAFGVFIVIVILFGIWLNRRRIFPSRPTDTDTS